MGCKVCSLITVMQILERNMNKHARLFLSFAYLLLIANNQIFASDQKNYDVRKGDLWEIEGGRAKSQITKTDGKLVSCLISPSAKYAACSRFLKTVKVFGDGEDNDAAHPISTRDIQSIVVFNLGDKSVVRELIAKQDVDSCDNVKLNGWIDDDQLRFYGLGELESRDFLFDVSKNETYQIGNYDNGTGRLEVDGFGAE